MNCQRFSPARLSASTVVILPSWVPAGRSWWWKLLASRRRRLRNSSMFLKRCCRWCVLDGQHLALALGGVDVGVGVVGADAADVELASAPDVVSLR